MSSELNDLVNLRVAIGISAIYSLEDEIREPALKFDRQSTGSTLGKTLKSWCRIGISPWYIHQNVWKWQLYRYIWSAQLSFRWKKLKTKNIGVILALLGQRRVKIISKLWIRVLCRLVFKSHINGMQMVSSFSPLYPDSPNLFICSWIT